jgi:hypothetical protein
MYEDGSCSSPPSFIRGKYRGGVSLRARPGQSASDAARASWAEVASRPAASNLSKIPRCRATILPGDSGQQTMTRLVPAYLGIAFRNSSGAQEKAPPKRG